MQTNFSDQLRQAISHERLDAYRQRGSSSDDAELFTHYAWNMALSEEIEYFIMNQSGIGVISKINIQRFWRP